MSEHATSFTDVIPEYQENNHVFKHSENLLNIFCVRERIRTSTFGLIRRYL